MENKIKYYALHPASYGTTVGYLGEFENFDAASDKADELFSGLNAAFWILPEDDLRGLYGSMHLVKGTRDSQRSGQGEAGGELCGVSKKKA